MSTSDNESTLGDFELAQTPTSIDELEQTADEDIVEQFQNLSRYATTAVINDNNETYFVGGTRDRNDNSFVLYHDPESEKTGAAGEIVHDETYWRDKPNDNYVGFSPFGDDPEEETEIEPVESLTVSEHNRSEKLSLVLAAIRTDLTDSTWMEDGRGNASYGEQIKATNKLADFINEEISENMLFPIQTVFLPEPEQGLFRYPHGAKTVMLQVEMGIERHLDNGVCEANPEVLRTLLLRYAEQNDLEEADLY